MSCAFAPCGLTSFHSFRALHAFVPSRIMCITYVPYLPVKKQSWKILNGKVFEAYFKGAINLKWFFTSNHFFMVLIFGNGFIMLNYNILYIYLKDLLNDSPEVPSHLRALCGLGCNVHIDSKFIDVWVSKHYITDTSIKTNSMKIKR